MRVKGGGGGGGEREREREKERERDCTRMHAAAGKLKPWRQSSATPVP